jgi:hypothetical protein
MVCFETKNSNLGKFWSALDWKMFQYFMAIWNILWRLGIFYDHLVHFEIIWYTFSGFGIMYQEKSGNPVVESMAARRCSPRAKHSLAYLPRLAHYYAVTSFWGERTAFELKRKKCGKKTFRKPTLRQGCQIIYIFAYQNPILGRFWRALEGKMLFYLIVIWYTYFMTIWKIF